MNSPEQPKDIFIAKSDVKAHDLDHKRKINFNIDRYNAAVVKGKGQFAALDTARRQAKNIKWRAVEQLDKYLELFEKNFTERGGKVIWAEDKEDALNAVLAICRDKNTRTVVKSKSMVTEELHLNDFLAEHEIESLETDLGEYIQQLDGEPPYHIVTPAMHKSKEDIAQLFHDKLGVPPGLSPSELTLIARDKLRHKYTEAEVGITGGNFLIADTGAVCITENEGNGRLSTAFPQTHIAIVGIEKILPSLQDLPLFWPLLATYGTGQTLTVYNSIFCGPRQAGETDGPREMYVILLDNGRTNLLRKEVRESMYCIRCGSCLNACPVYRNIGGHTYGSTYSGPIGSVITPHLNGMAEFGHLSYASSLCGSCTDACPIKINIHEMLLENRHIYTEEKYDGFAERFAWRLFKRGVLHRGLMNGASGRMKNFVFEKALRSAWGDRRDKVVFAPKSFNQLWKERKKA
ncbi:LutB/LldF family L-lactate oxidation iron-sulfur protein [Taibaiella helva]|uniref:LutB/LldF family L-lactate oxidation iron-sulfur protein n=1 Tax=Taibaiella helva TaxID=2301235 RepID=UPI000E590D1C|nr:LutB/LldF family L-lactate oxidation iron-sulfur protein [Taibaiella helva]